MCLATCLANTGDLALPLAVMVVSIFNMHSKPKQGITRIWCAWTPKEAECQVRAAVALAPGWRWPPLHSRAMGAWEDALSIPTHRHGVFAVHSCGGMCGLQPSSSAPACGWQGCALRHWHRSAQLRCPRCDRIQRPVPGGFPPPAHRAAGCRRQPTAPPRFLHTHPTQCWACFDPECSVPATLHALSTQLPSHTTGNLWGVER